MTGQKITPHATDKPAEYLVKVIPDLATLVERLAGGGRAFLTDGKDPIAALVAERASDDT